MYKHTKTPTFAVHFLLLKSGIDYRKVLEIHGIMINCIKIIKIKDTPNANAKKKNDETIMDYLLRLIVVYYSIDKRDKENNILITKMVL